MHQNLCSLLLFIWHVTCKNIPRVQLSVVRKSKSFWHVTHLIVEYCHLLLRNVRRWESSSVLLIPAAYIASGPLKLSCCLIPIRGWGKGHI
jgi:hypothetical protein